MGLYELEGREPLLLFIASKSSGKVGRGQGEAQEVGGIGAVAGGRSLGGMTGRKRPPLVGPKGLLQKVKLGGRGR